MLLCAGVVVVVIGVLWVTVPRLVVGGVGGGVDITVGVGGVGVADGEGVTVVAGVSRGGLVAWVLLVLVLGAACVLVFGGSGRATRGWCVVGLWSWWCRLSLVLGLSFGCPWVCSDRCCFGCGLGCQCCGWVAVSPCCRCRWCRCWCWWGRRRGSCECWRCRVL